MQGLARFGPPLGFALLLLALWEGLCRGLNVPLYLVPPPSAVAHALIQNAPALFGSAAVTLTSALSALVLAAAIALPLALAAALSPLVERALSPLAVTLQVTPIVAVAPLAVIWAGLDHPERATTALAALAAFFPLFSGALTGLKSADPDLERLFDLYGAHPLQRLLRLRLPAATPFLLEGFKVGVGLAVIGAVVAEIAAGSGGSQGLAWRILQSNQQLRTDETFASLAALAVLAVGLHALAAKIEARILWQWQGR